MALQTITAGQVLTAAQVTALQANDYNQTVNNYTDSRVLTIADLGDRVVMNKATATTITVNTGIFAAGDTLWIHNIGAGVCTITAGTATVTTSGSLALAQNAGGTLYFTSTGAAIFFPTVASSAQGLTLLNTTSFSGVASQSFSSVFTDTYTTYRITLRVTGTATATLNLRFRENTTDKTTNYFGATHYVAYTSTEGVAYASAGGTGSCSLMQNDSNGGFASFDLQRNSGGAAAGFTGTAWSAQNGQGHYFGYYNLGGTNFNGFSLIPASGNISGEVSIYGYNK